MSTTDFPRTPQLAPRDGAGLRFYAVYGWAILGVSLLLVNALVRLAPIAWEPIADGSLGGMEWAVLAGWVAFNAYCEGYRGFQKAFCPRVTARAFHVARGGSALHAALAPAFCMSLFHASRRGLIASWTLLAGIVTLVIIVRGLSQPWRGIIDAGVVVGLGWGVVALWVIALRSLVSGPPRVKMNLPEPEPNAAAEARGFAR